MNRNDLLFLFALGVMGGLVYWRAKQNRQKEQTKELNKSLSRWENEGGNSPDPRHSNLQKRIQVLQQHQRF
jgi:hypothetical protein